MAQIQKIESERETIYELLSDVSIYQRDPKAAAQAQAREEDIMDELLELYERWEELEGA